MNRTLLTQCAVGAIVVLATMLVTIRLFRYAAHLFQALLCLGGCGYVAYNVLAGTWTRWETIAVQSIVTGVVVAVLSLPLLPFTKSRED